ncbi:PAS domain S-box protein [Burkholderia cenocepacia]|uniref:PAS domain S-box protein n=1 Tax=Burkholderia cenocepacia TaxID=95486 RepID=UPI000F57E36E|nr:PAS domain S-box protein [Burkholderia cenocepacia]RQU97827.1 PAS domain S-box protein [Burkholderia cenocepacia]
MNGNTAFRDLGEFLGSSKPVWKFGDGKDELVLSATGQDTDQSICVRLAARQAEQIRRMTGATSMLIINAQVFGKDLALHLIGRRIRRGEWAGVAASLYDSEAVATNSMKALAFSEGVISEVNAIVVVLDKFGTIHRFNRRAEEYTGCREESVIGENAQQLFMSPEEGAASRQNIAGFFDRGAIYDVQRMIETVDGSLPFVFRNRFIRNPQSGEAEFIVCSGVELGDGNQRTAEPTAEGEAAPAPGAETIVLLDRVMNMAAMMDGVRALLASMEEGGTDQRSIAHAKRLATSALRDTYALYEQIDSRAIRST